MEIIQGGMGIGVSDWRLARAVSQEGALGVVSGTALDSVFIRRLQKGDEGGVMRKALEAFPCRETAAQLREKWFVEGGIPDDASFRLLPLYTETPGENLLKTTAAAAFCEVWLAKQGHTNPVGINLLDKVSLPNPAALYGAMLAGVDYVLMGAGIPLAIPGLLDRFAEGLGCDFPVPFHPAELFPQLDPPPKRPRFLGIVSSHIVAEALARKASGRVDGFIIEDHTAGGHNAPPRKKHLLTETGEPVYTERDEALLDRVRALGLPFWLAGSRGVKGMAAKVKELGAAGIQVGSLFTCAVESGFTTLLKEKILTTVRSGKASVFTDPDASPTGFPFKILRLAGTLSEQGLAAARKRVCSLGYLRTAVAGEAGPAYHCSAAEPAGTDGPASSLCLCNALMAAIGLGSRTEANGEEAPLITLGSGLAEFRAFLESVKPLCERRGEILYRASDVIWYLGGLTSSKIENKLK